MKRQQRSKFRLTFISIAIALALFTNSATGFQAAQPSFSKFWIEAGAGGSLPAEMNLENPLGKVEIGRAHV